MVLRDFRDFLVEVERRGDMKLVEGADCDLEIGTLTEIMCEQAGPMLLFDRIIGYPKGYRIATKPYYTPARTALALGLPEGVTPFEMFKAWKTKFKSYRPIQPVPVPSGPVMENVLEGDAVDLTKFPTPKWHEKDGGPYFGTGCVVITREPKEGWVNVGSYRWDSCTTFVGYWWLSMMILIHPTRKRSFGLWRHVQTQRALLKSSGTVLRAP